VPFQCVLIFSARHPCVPPWSSKPRLLRCLRLMPLTSPYCIQLSRSKRIRLRMSICNRWSSRSSFVSSAQFLASKCRRSRITYTAFPPPLICTDSRGKSETVTVVARGSLECGRSPACSLITMPSSRLFFGHRSSLSASFPHLDNTHSRRLLIGG
jgi:hypothetical protein